ncbi:MAG: hypothetical protein CMM50_13345 [Rhodospirillaceae bacterium]|nr:hypothetical protein [Rhodospirillaceae bacterium]
MSLQSKANPAAEAEHRVEIVPTAKRVRVMFGGETVADSTGVLIIRETRHMPVYYFPPEDVRRDLLSPTDHHTHCPYKGDASYWTVRAGGHEAENAVWSYPEPLSDVAGLSGYLAFYWDRMDAWYEEDEQVFVHPRDPFVRIDVLESRRRVRVVLGGETVADTTHALFLFETGHRPRYYIPTEDVRTDLLHLSSKRTGCPYKGFARYWSVSAGGRVFEDVVWSYPDPSREVARIKERLCFYEERVDSVLVARSE